MRARVDQSDTRLLVQARDIQTGQVVATSDVDESTAEYELASLPEGSYLLELIGFDVAVLCTDCAPKAPSKSLGTGFCARIRTLRATIHDGGSPSWR